MTDYSALIALAPDPIITVDSLGTILYVNIAAEEVSGYKADELIGKHFTKTGVLTPAGLAKALQELAWLLTGQHRPPYELEIVRKNGTKFFVEAHGKLIMMPDSRQKAIQVVFRDITHRKAMEGVLQKQNAELEQINRIMTNREERILELKKEVNELLRKLNQPARYDA